MHTNTNIAPHIQKLYESIYLKRFGKLKKNNQEAPGIIA